MIEAVKLEADIYPAGPRGLSAYEIYKKEGGQLSEEEWLKSLNGLTPTIGENGNWFLGTVDTGLPSRGPKGDTGSIKFIVVTELPTENIDETAIYMKPVEKPTGKNKFEELIYANGKWEDLGTPDVEVDLSNYYTKDETNEELAKKQDNLTAGENITIENNVISASGGEPIYEINLNESNLTYIDRLDKTMISNIITSMYNDANHIGRLRIKLKLSNENIVDVSFVDFFPCEKSVPFTQLRQYKFLSEVFYQVSGAPINQYNIYLSFGYIVINGSWTEDVFTCTGLNYGEGFRKAMYKFALTDNVLTKGNTTAYTPTKDYHPSTKKYVDDNVKTYTAGNNIEISEDNVISSNIGLPVIENQEINIHTFPVGSYIITGTDTVIKYGVNGASSYKPITTNSSTGNTDSWVLNITHDTATENNRGYAFLFRKSGSSGSAALYTFDFSGMNYINIGQLMERNVNQSIYGRFDFYHALPISSLVPSSDMELTNKKYVDDTIKTHYEKMTGYDATKTQVLKNINGTLTWVDEV